MNEVIAAMKKSALTPLQRRILDVLPRLNAEHGAVSTALVASACGKRPVRKFEFGVCQSLRGLERRGYVQQTLSGNKDRWSHYEWLLTDAGRAARLEADDNG